MKPLAREDPAWLYERVAALQRELEAVRDREAELSDFIDNASVAIHAVAADGTILWANQAELDLLGYTREEYVGRHIAEFHADQPAIDAILKRLRGRETIIDQEARLRCKDGSVRHVMITSNARWKQGQFAHTRCFTRDITAYKVTAQTLRET